MDNDTDLLPMPEGEGDLHLYRKEFDAPGNLGEYLDEFTGPGDLIWLVGARKAVFRFWAADLWDAKEIIQEIEATTFIEVGKPEEVR